MSVPRATRVCEPTFHPSDRRIAEFAESRACRTERIVMEAHLFHCKRCSRAVADATPRSDAEWNAAAAEAREGGSSAPSARSGLAFDRLWGRVEQSGTVRWPKEAAVLPPGVLAELEPAERWSWMNLWPSGTRYTVLVREPSANRELYLAYYGKDSAFPMHYHVEPEDNVILAGGYKNGTQQVLAGDWVDGIPGTRHSPRTARDEECWCLSLVHVGGSKLETFHGRFQAWLEAWQARRERLP